MSLDSRCEGLDPHTTNAASCMSCVPRHIFIFLAEPASIETHLHCKVIVIKRKDIHPLCLNIPSPSQYHGQ